MAKSKKNTTQRFGAAALATATVVSGLAFGPGAVAAPVSTESPVVSSVPSAGEDFGAFTPVAATSTELTPGGTAMVQTYTRTSAALTSLDSTVTMTAPAGTTFASAADRAFSFKKPGDTDWTRSATVKLTGGVLSDASKTITYQADNETASFNLPAGTQLRFDTVIRTPAPAVGGEGLALGMVHVGTSSAGAFQVTATAPVSIKSDFGAISAIEVESVDLVRGSETEVSGVVETASEVTSMTSKLTFTAPAGTTFADAEDRSVPYLETGEQTWRESVSLRLTGGVRVTASRCRPARG
jgi:hypothetical protein